MSVERSWKHDIGAFLKESQNLNGREVRERAAWNCLATTDAIRHVAYGISDDNPLWTDPAYAAGTRYGGPVAPPAFLCSVLYPVLHGAPIQVPLSSFIAELSFEWFRPVLEGDALRGSTRQADAFETRDRREQPTICILSEASYYNQREELVGFARSTLARSLEDGDVRVERDVYRYTEQELDRIASAQRNNHRTGDRWLNPSQIELGQELPSLVRGPLTIGDMVCWQAAIGPSYRPGALGYRDTLDAPHTVVTHPVTGWPIKYSQQHEDFMLAPQRGMPAPFDNGVMRFAWITPLLTDWIGDQGWLQQLSITLHKPNLYGDTTWYCGRVVEKSKASETTTLRVKISGKNQLGEMTTSGEAVVIVPSLRPIARHRIHLKSGMNQRNSLSQPLESVHRVFESIVARSPDALAVTTGHQHFTFAEINARANRLAHRLRRAGIESGEPVVVCLKRSADWIVAELAVLKAGGAFVPLDPTYPESRIKKMLADCGSQFAIAARDFSSILEKNLVNLIDPLAVGEAADLHSGDNLEVEIDGAQAAYIMYTSGSTGEPNGVVVPHRSLSMYLDAMRDALEVTADDVFLHTASFSFSASIRQTFLPLCVGARVVVVGEEERRDPQALLQQTMRENATVWDTVPGAWRQSIEALSNLDEALRTAVAKCDLRLILVTGEALPWEVPSMWRNLVRSRTEIINLYSQTETVGTASLFRIPSNSSEQRGIVPLGHAVPHTRLYVLGPEGRQVRDGEPGDIWVGGDRLASCYLNLAKLTADRFIPDPFRGGTGARMYRTGDRGRRRADGVLEYIGRVDHRINIRGYRVEPAEVEAVISDHPDVTQAVVLAREDNVGDTRLVAYVTARPEACPSVNGVQRYRLPNGLAIAQLNRHETDFTYKAIFEDQTYLKHGITIHDGDCVFDIGANIGLFSLFVSLACKAPRIVAFEPNPMAFDILEANARLYGLDARLMCFGLDRDERNGDFTAFSGFSILSGLHADEAAEKELVRTFAANQQKLGLPVANNLIKRIDEILSERFRSQSFDVPLKPLSSIIEQEGIERIDLLKINVEKSELGVLNGIRSEHWGRIKQVVVKVDVAEHVAEIVRQLEKHGLQTAVDQDPVAAGSRIQTIYAIRSSNHRRRVHPAPDRRRELPYLEDRILTASDLRQRSMNTLPYFMVPSLFEIVESLPRSPNGKLDRSALPEPDWTRPGSETKHGPPDTELHRKMMRIWADVLSVETVGLDEGFLDLGGDSIKAIRILNRIRQELNIDIPVTSLLASSATVASLVKIVNSHRN